MSRFIQLTPPKMKILAIPLLAENLFQNELIRVYIHSARRLFSTVYEKFLHLQCQ